MNRYTIYCTSEQTMRAYKLGAPIENIATDEACKDGYCILKYYDKYCRYKLLVKYPTLEQMCGWLREKNIFINVCHNCDGYGTWLKKILPSEPIGDLIGYFETEPQAILAAIDAALGYLEKGGYNGNN